MSKFIPIDLQLEARLMTTRDRATDLRVRGFTCLDLLPKTNREGEYLPIDYFTNPQVRRSYDLTCSNPKS